MTLCFFGDGASNEGTFHESLNLASIWKLPVIFLCENNGYGATTPVSAVMAVPNVADRAPGYGIPGSIVDGQDVVLVYERVREAVERARRGEGPTLIEAKTYRYADHAVNLGPGFAIDRGEELAKWRRRDPIALFRARMIEAGIGEQAITDIEAAGARGGGRCHRVRPLEPVPGVRGGVRSHLRRAPAASPTPRVRLNTVRIGAQHGTKELS